MSTPYEKTVVTTPLNAGADNWVTFPFMHRGQLTKITIKQTSGVDAGFDMDIFNSMHAQDGAGYDKEAYKVLPTQTVVSGGRSAGDLQRDQRL
jgi:hypothetical protein